MLSLQNSLANVRLVQVFGHTPNCCVKSLEQVSRYFLKQLQNTNQDFKISIQNHNCHLRASMGFLSITPSTWMLILICFLFQSQLKQYSRGDCLSNILHRF